MSKKISLLILLGVLMLPLIASAQLGGYCGWGTGRPCASFVGLIDNILTAAWIIFCAIAVICFVIAGILFLTAGGDPAKLKTARSAFIWGVAGVIVGIIAYSIVYIMEGFLIYDQF